MKFAKYMGMDSEAAMGIRVLHVLDKINVSSGVSSVVMNYYSKLEHSRLTFDFMLNEDTDEKTRTYIESNGSKIYIMPELKAVNVFKYIKALRIFYQDHPYSIINGHVANSALLYLGLAKNIPLRIIHSHSTKLADNRLKSIRNYILTRFIRFVANEYVACGEDAAKFLFKKKIAFILSNAVDVRKFLFHFEERERIRRQLGADHAFIIGHTGRFCEQKNHVFLINVFRRIYDINKNARLMLIGDGELFDDIMCKIKQLGLEEAVLFVRTTSNMESYMSAMDVFVLPSLFEGLPLVGIEAQASGLKVIASDRVTREMDITGNVVFLKLDIAVWAETLASLDKSDDRLEQGDEVKGSRFDIETQTRRLYEYYEKLLIGV